MKETPLPLDWGKDPLSAFIEDANHNTLATFVNLKPEFTHLEAINHAFKKITDNLKNPKVFIPALFLFRSHSSYLGAVRLAVSGQIPETYMVLRGCLENSFYALHIDRVPGNGEVWINRNNDLQSLQQCKNNFRISTVLGTLKSKDVILHKSAKQLYEMTIEYGGHPNEMSLSSIMSKSEDESKIDFKIAYLTSYKVNRPAFQLCLKNTARTGICSLMIFKAIFQERFDILGISDELEKLKQGL